jgi:hypothetical protein
MSWILTTFTLNNFKNKVFKRNIVWHGAKRRQGGALALQENRLAPATASPLKNIYDIIKS